jgi:hypothetical protein
MSIELADTPDVIPPSELPAEYILVADNTSEVLAACLGWENAGEMRKTASLIRKAGGSVTIFKATKY